MEEYKPKRIDFKVFGKGQRSLCISITKETYNNFVDYYIYGNFWWFNITLVFLRFIR